MDRPSSRCSFRTRPILVSAVGKSRTLPASRYPFKLSHGNGVLKRISLETHLGGSARVSVCLKHSQYRPMSHDRCTSLPHARPVGCLRCPSLPIQWWFLALCQPSLSQRLTPSKRIYFTVKKQLLEARKVCLWFHLLAFHPCNRLPNPSSPLFRRGTSSLERRTSCCPWRQSLGCPGQRTTARRAEGP